MQIITRLVPRGARKYHPGSTAGVPYGLFDIHCYRPLSKGLMLGMGLGLAGEDAQVDGVGHGLIAGVVGVQVVAGVELGAVALGVLRIAGSGFEVHHSVVSAAGADPVVESLADGFPALARIAGALVGREGAADHADAMGVRLFDDLAVGRDEVLSGEAFAGGSKAVADVIDAFENHQPLDARLAEDVAVEAGQGARACAVMQHAVAANALIRDAEVGSLLLGGEAGGQQGGPGVIGLGGGAGAVSDGIAEGHDGAGGGGRIHVDGGQPVVRLGGGGVGQGGAAGEVAGADIGGVQGGPVAGGKAGIAGEVEADGEVGQGIDGEIDGVAEEDHAGLQGAAGLTVESQGAVGTLDDGGVLGAQGDVGGGDFHGCVAEGIFEFDAEAAAAEGGADHHADGLAVESAGADRDWTGRCGRLRRGGRCRRGGRRGVGGAGEQLGGGPGDHPVLFAARLSLGDRALGQDEGRGA